MFSSGTELKRKRKYDIKNTEIKDSMLMIYNHNTIKLMKSTYKQMTLQK